jgi:hypothetical protein
MDRDVSQVFKDPGTYLEVFLAREIDRFTQIQDDRPLSKRVWVLLGAGFESTLLGAQQMYSPTEDPWVDQTPVIQRHEDLDRLGLPNFYESGLMPLAHRYYEELSELVQGTSLQIEFADWARSPFGVALVLRGMEQLLVDLMQEPNFFTRFLAFVTESAILYRKERARFLGTPLDKPTFHDDDVNVPTISPKSYQDMILPLEKEFADAFGGLLYWHSCGDVTPMIPLIREIPAIDIFHCGPWTNVGRTAEVFGDVTLDICIHSMDVYETDEADMRSKVRSIVQACKAHGVRSFSIRPGILQAYGSIEQDLASIARWVRVAKETVKENRL